MDGGDPGTIRRALQELDNLSDEDARRQLSDA
jgi:hypothetical protein